MVTSVSIFPSVIQSELGSHHRARQLDLICCAGLDWTGLYWRGLERAGEGWTVTVQFVESRAGRVVSQVETVGCERGAVEGGL